MGKDGKLQVASFRPLVSHDVPARQARLVAGDGGHKADVPINADGGAHPQAVGYCGKIPDAGAVACLIGIMRQDRAA